MRLLLQLPPPAYFDDCWVVEKYTIPFSGAIPVLHSLTSRNQLCSTQKSKLRAVFKAMVRWMLLRCTTRGQPSHEMPYVQSDPPSFPTERRASGIFISHNWSNNLYQCREDEVVTCLQSSSHWFHTFILFDRCQSTFQNSADWVFRTANFHPHFPKEKNRWEFLFGIKTFRPKLFSQWRKGNVWIYIEQMLMSVRYYSIAHA